VHDAQPPPTSRNASNGAFGCIAQLTVPVAPPGNASFARISTSTSGSAVVATAAVTRGSSRTANRAALTG
jgi:hypothetical protein